MRHKSATKKTKPVAKRTWLAVSTFMFLLSLVLIGFFLRAIINATSVTVDKGHRGIVVSIKEPTIAPLTEYTVNIPELNREVVIQRECSPPSRQGSVCAPLREVGTEARVVLTQTGDTAFKDDGSFYLSAAIFIAFLVIFPLAGSYLAYQKSRGMF